MRRSGFRRRTAALDWEVMARFGSGIRRKVCGESLTAIDGCAYQPDYWTKW